MTQKSRDGNGLFTTLGEYIPSGFFTKTWFTTEELTLGIPQTPTYEQHWYVWSTILHEWCHHLQMIGTTYGRFHYDLTVTGGACACDALRRLFHARKLGVLHRPLLRDLVDARADIDDESLVLGAKVQLCRSALLGDKTETLPSTPSGILPPAGSASPRVTVDGEEYVMGARHALESHASCNERINLLMTVEAECYAEAMGKLDILDPYRMVEALLLERLGKDDEILARVLSDIALDPDWPLESSQIAWEDFHPGWRMARIIDVLATDRSLRALVPVEMDWDQISDYERLYFALLEHFDWKRPESILPASDEAFPWFTAKAAQVRRDHPLAFALVIENTKILSDVSPVNIDSYTPRGIEPTMGLGMDGATEFEARRIVAAIFEKTVPQMITTRTLSCPFHDTVFPSEAGCPDRCYFKGFFRSLFGIEVEEFLTIPVRPETL